MEKGKSTPIPVSSIHKSYEWFFEIVAENFLPHFEGEKEILDELIMMKLPYTLDNVMHIMHLK